MQGDKLGRQASGSQEQPRREIMKGDIPGYLGYKAAAKSSPEEILKGDKLGTQRSSGGQEQPRMEMKRDKLGRQGGSGSQEQPRSNIMKRDKLGKQGRSDRQYFFLRFTCSLAFAHPPWPQVCLVVFLLKRTQGLSKGTLMVYGHGSPFSNSGRPKTAQSLACHSKGRGTCLVLKKWNPLRKIQLTPPKTSENKKQHKKHYK